MKAKFFALAALVLGLASCVQDVDTVSPIGGEVNYQLSVAAPELAATRAGENGEADLQNAYDSAYGGIDYVQGGENDPLRYDWNDVNLRYTLEVYDKADDYTGATPVKDRMVIIVDKYEPVTFDLRLVPNRDYHFVVFADFVANDVLTDSFQHNATAQAELGLRHSIGATLETITVKDDALNDEIADAYFATLDVNVKNSKPEQIVLRRPYAKLRVIATDLAELNTNVEPAKLVVKYESTHAYQFNAITGEIAGEEGKVATYEVAYNEIYKDVEKGGLANHTYTVGYDAEKVTSDAGVERHSHMTLMADYILAKNEQEAIHFEISAYDKDGGLIKTTNFDTDIPVQRNFLTTVIGNVLTTATEIEVRIDDNFAGNHYFNLWDGKSATMPEYVDAEKTYLIREASELAWVAAQVNGTTRAAANTFEGYTVKLVKDIHLNGERWDPIGSTGLFKGTFDGNGHKIEGLFVYAEGKASAGLFATNRGLIKDLTVVNSEVYGHYKTAVIVADGLCSRVERCTVDNCVVVSTPYNKDDANNVGAITGYLSAEPTAYVKDCVVKNTQVTAYRKVGGVVGAANGKSVVTGNEVENVIVIADQTAEYKEVKAAEAGAIVGYKHADATVDNNTITGGDVIVKLDSVAEMNANKADNEVAHVTLAEGTYNFTEALTVNGAIQANLGGNVVLNVNGQNITTGTSADYGFIALGEGNSLEINDANISTNGGCIAAVNGAQVTFNGDKLALTTGITNPRYNFYAEGAGSKIIVNGGDISFSAKTLRRAYVYAGEGTEVIINGGTFGKPSSKSGYTEGILGPGKVTIYGGTFGFDPSKWLADSYTAKKVGENWVVMAPEVATAEEFATRLQDNIEEIYVVLSEDLDVAISSLGSQTPGSGEYKLGGESTEKITIDLGGKTLNITTTYWSAIGAKNNDALFTIKNGTMTSTGNSAGTWNAWDIRLSNCNYAIENVTFEKAVALDNVGKSTSMKNVTITDNHNTDTYGLWITAEGQTVTLDGCVIDMTPASDGRGIKIDNQYVAAGSEEKVTLNVANTTFKTDEKAAILVKNPAGADITLENVDIENVAADPAFAVWVDEDAAAYADLVNVTGGLKKVEGSKSGVSASTQADFAEAVGNSETSTIVLTAGTYNMPSTGGKELTIIGNKDVIINAGAANMGNGNVTLEGVTITAGSYKGFQHSGVVTYNNVTIKGQLNCYGKEDIFNNCTFELNNAYVWTYGSKKTVFSGCTFNTTGKAILIYNEGAGACNVEVTGCTFNASAGAKAGAIANQNCAAIEIDNYKKMAHKLTTSGNTVNPNFSGEWRIKSYEEGAPVTVNGVAYTYIALDGKKMTIDGEKNVTVVE